MTLLLAAGLCVVVALISAMAGIYVGDGLGYKNAIRDVAGKMTSDELEAFRQVLERTGKPEEEPQC